MNDAGLLKKKSAIKQKFGDSAKAYSDAAAVQQLSGERLVAQLRALLPFTAVSQALTNRKVIDLGCGPGTLTAPLLKTLPIERLLGVDLSPEMITRATVQQRSYIEQGRADFVCADFDALDPRLLEAHDLMVSNLALHWSSHFPQLLRLLDRFSSDRAVLAFTLPGPGTLEEIDLAWQQIDASRAVNRFMSMAQVQQYVREAGFDLIWCRQEPIVHQYDSALEAVKSLKNTGVTVRRDNQHMALLGKDKYQRFLQALSRPAKYACFGKRTSLTYEILYVVCQKVSND